MMLPTLMRRKGDFVDWYDDLDSFFGRATTPSDGINVHYPKVDIHETEQAYILEADLPGLDKKDVGINIDGQVLTISGHREDKREEKKKGFYRLERQVGEFERQFSLGDQVDYAQAEAEFDRGVLKVTLPKKEEAKPKQLEIKVK